ISTASGRGLQSNSRRKARRFSARSGSQLGVWNSVKPSRMQNWHGELDGRVAHERPVPPPAATRSASLCPAIASSARTVHSPAMPEAWRKSVPFWRWKGVSRLYFLYSFEVVVVVARMSEDRLKELLGTAWFLDVVFDMVPIT